MAELADTWSAQGKLNCLGNSVVVTQMQSEGGAAGAIHGAAQGGCLATTFTASQVRSSLLLITLNGMYHIGFDVNGSGDAQNCRPDAPCGISCGSTTGCEQENVGIHIVQVGATADSIFGEHSDVMATRSTGVCILSSHSVQEVMDLALVAHVAAFSIILLIF